MLDVERDLRELLDRKADANTPPAPLGLPETLRRRTRRRQTGTAALAGLVAITVVAASVAGLNLLRDDGARKAAHGPPPFSVHQPPVPEGPGRYRLAEGEAAGSAWTVFAVDDADGTGVEIDSGDATRINPEVVPDQEPVEALPRGFGPGPEEYVHIGAVVREAATVEALQANGNSIPGAVLSLAPVVDVRWSAFVVQSPVMGTTALVFRDADGGEVARIEVEGSPSDPQPGDEVGLADRYKNPLGFTRLDSAGDVAWTEPGGTATVAQMRATARTVLTRVMEEAYDWWTARPADTSPDIEFEDWWSLYPIADSIEGEPTYVALADCARPSIQDHEIPADTPTVAVFFSCSLDPPGDPMTIYRIDRAYANAAPLTQALNQLFSGPTRYELEHGFYSFFSQESADLLNFAQVDGAGHATVDLKPFEGRIDGNSSTSTGGMLLIASLSSTVFQFENIESITYQVEGDCDAFWRWFESSCGTVERATWEEHTRVVE